MNACFPQVNMQIAQIGCLRLKGNKSCYLKKKTKKIDNLKILNMKVNTIPWSTFDKHKE